MDKKKLSAALPAAAALYPMFATADSVNVNGTTYTCTNSCKVTLNSNGTYSVKDCCGGRVRFTIQPQK